MDGSELEGARLCCCYSLITNELGFCGPPRIAEMMKGFIMGGEMDTNLLKKFEALYSYLDIISKKHGLKIFDARVVEAYWLGNELSGGFGPADLQALVSSLESRGLPKSFGDGLLENPPKTMPFTHNFHVFYIGVGRTTGCLPQTVENMGRCMISNGVVKGVSDDKLVVSKKELVKDGKLRLKPVEVDIAYDPDLLSPKEGDIVSIHWSHAVRVISKEQKNNLERLTGEVLAICQKYRYLG